MKKKFNREIFDELRDRDPSAEFSDVEFDRCVFQGCAFGMTLTRSARRRTHIRSVVLRNCEVRACHLDGAIVEDVMIDGLKTHGLHQCFGVVYKHVVLRGRIGRLMLSSTILPASADERETKTAAVQREFDEANATFYEGVDWALDISEGEFEELDLRGIPARLIRRDPETQFVVTRERALLGEWRSPEFGMAAQFMLDFFLKSGKPDFVLVAAKRSKKFAERLAEFRQLRERGIAEAD